MKNLSVSMRKSETIPGWIYFALQATILPVVLVLVNMFLHNPLGEAELNFTFFFLNFGFAVFIFRRFLLESGKAAFGDLGKLLKGAVIGFVAYWIFSIFIGNLILWLYPDFSNVNDDSIATLVEENSSLIAFATVWLVPITEELFYRGLIFRGIYNRSRLLAYVVSTLAFAAVHVVGYIGLYEPMLLALCFMQYLPAGICLGFAYAKADSIWAPILIHTCINYIGMLAMR